MARGGYREPARPASVSGPGSKSRRTDGGPAQVLRDLPNAAYGEGSQFRQLQQDAPLANSQATRPAATPQGGGPVPLTEFGAPTTRPDEPVTTGNPLGPGAGPEVNTPAPDQPDMTNIVAMLPVLVQIANGPNGTPALRSLVRYMKGRA